MPEEQIDHRETVAHMVSEFLREIAALILVFVPLDYLLKGDQPVRFFWYDTAWVLVVSLVLVVFGILVERELG